METTAYENITCEVIDDQIALVTLNRPERLNALSTGLLTELLHAVRAIENDAAIRAWIVTGAPRPDGRPCFSAGVDLREAAGGVWANHPHLGNDLMDTIDNMLKPSIAAIDGICTTGGGELVTSCDIRMVGAAAQISDWHLKNLGSGLGTWGASTRWARLVGAAMAKDMFLTGRVMDAGEALRSGFATRSYPSEELLDQAIAAARSIAAMSPDGVRVTLAHFDHTAGMSKEEALRWAAMLPRWLDVRGSVAAGADKLASRRES